MKKCPCCTAQNVDIASFCEKCGADLRNVAPASEGTGAADFINKAREAAASVAGKAKEAVEAGTEKIQKAMADAGEKAEERYRENLAAEAREAAAAAAASAPIDGGGASSGRGSSMFVDQSETIVSVIGNNYLESYLSGGKVSQSIGILTQKRFYFKGQNFFGSGKELKNATQEGVVSLEDITFTMFTYVRHIGYLIFGVLMAIAAVICIAGAADMHGSSADALSAIGTFVGLAGLILVIMYFVKRMTVFQVSFPGGGFGFDIRLYPIADIRDFQRQLHLLKDHIKENGC